jgi:hypothetical protein
MSLLEALQELEQDSDVDDRLDGDEKRDEEPGQDLICAPVVLTVLDKFDLRKLGPVLAANGFGRLSPYSLRLLQHGNAGILFAPIVDKKLTLGEREVFYTNVVHSLCHMGESQRQFYLASLWDKNLAQVLDKLGLISFWTCFFTAGLSFAVLRSCRLEDATDDLSNKLTNETYNVYTGMTKTVWTTVNNWSSF